MIEPTDTQSAHRTRLIISGVCLFMAVLLVVLFLANNSNRPLQPVRTLATAELVLISSEANFVTFPELDANPTAYLNQFIRVSGTYNPLRPPTCQPYNGPSIHWSLISEGLQLDATGYEAILREVPPNTILTVEGIWRRYHGPYGCGKEPPANDAWHLEVMQIIQPNPLFGADAIALDTILGPGPLPTEAGLPTPTATVVVVETAVLISPTPTPTFLFTPTATPTTLLLVTETPTTAVGTPNITTTPITPTPTLTPTPLTITPGATRIPTQTPTITPTPTLGSVPPTVVPDPYQGPTPVPPAPTATRPGYP